MLGLNGANGNEHWFFRTEFDRANMDKEWVIALAQHVPDPKHSNDKETDETRGDGGRRGQRALRGGGNLRRQSEREDDDSEDGARDADRGTVRLRIVEGPALSLEGESTADLGYADRGPGQVVGARGEREQPHEDLVAVLRGFDERDQRKREDDRQRA